MKTSIFAVVAGLCFLFLTGHNGFAEPTGENLEEQRCGNWFSAGYGAFSPDGDLADEDYEGGLNYTFSYVRLFEDYLGFGIDMNRYTCDNGAIILGRRYREELITTGIELLLLMRPKDQGAPDLQPYVGIGLGLYENEFSYDWVGQSSWAGSGLGAGFVAKVGIRFFLTNRMYFAVNAKYFTNSQQVQVLDANGDRQSVDWKIGGRTAGGELGFSF